MTEYKRLHAAGLEGWEQTEARRRVWIEQNRPAPEVQSHDERLVKKKAEFEALTAQFPFHVTLEGSYPEHDLAARWCWRNLGEPKCDKCWDSGSEYPGCPLVLATGKSRTSTWTDRGGNEHQYEYMEYGEVDDHGHDGTWRIFWWGKTGYDYGFSAYLFSTQADHDRFVEAIPQLIDEDE